jgi:AraC-like DNA-binding protein
MRSKRIIETTRLQEGEYLECVFDNYVEMVRHAVDWTLFCIYQLKPGSLNGSIRILELPHMQISHSRTYGALMYDFVVPEGCINLAVLERVADKACVDQMKLESGMIGVMDDSRIYNYLHNDEIRLFDVCLKPGASPLLRDRLSRAMDQYYIDTDKAMAQLIAELIDTHAGQAPISGRVAARIETRITEALLHLTDRQEARKPHFTPSEQAALAVRKQLFDHMDGRFSSESLAREQGITTRSLQSAFKSLYGFTPNQFIRLLKLNLVHHELIQADSSQTTVSRVAQKWGFQHMGRFANHYAALFGEPPSASLKKANPLPSGIHVDCTERKEEF